MKKYILSAICFLFLSSDASALDLSRVKTWSTSEILTAADLNGEFNNILNHSLTNNDIDAAAGIVGSKLNLSSPGVIGATTPAAATYTTLTINSTSIFKDKMSFTQTDNNEYIDSLADGYLDFEATTGLRFRINTAEQVNLTDGIFAPTTDNDIDLGSTTKEFKDLWIDGTANIDSLVADTADINGGTMDGVQVGGTTATGELLVNDALDDADGLGSQGTSGQVLKSAGTGVNPAFSDEGLRLVSTTAISSSNSGDITIEASKVYKIIISLTSTSADDTILLRINSNSGANYEWLRVGANNTTTPASVLSGGVADSSINLGAIDVGSISNKYFKSELLMTTTVVGNDRVQIFGQVLCFTVGGLKEIVQILGSFNDTNAPTSFEILSSGGATLTGNIYLYQYGETL